MRNLSQSSEVSYYKLCTFHSATNRFFPPRNGIREKRIDCLGRTSMWLAQGKIDLMVIAHIIKVEEPTQLVVPIVHGTVPGRLSFVSINRSTMVEI